MEHFLSTVLGGILAASTGWFLENRREAKRLRRARLLLATGIADDLKHSLELYDRVKDDWSKMHMVWFGTLIELRESRQAYYSLRESVVLFDDAELRRRLFQYYHKSTGLINQLESQETRRLDFEMRFPSVVQNIRAQDPTLSEKEARQQAATLFGDAYADYLKLQQSVPENVSDLVSLKSDAQKLLTDMEGIK